MNLTTPLSKRETQVAEVLAFTKSKEQAADRLCIATGTLAAHSFRIYEKLGIHTKAELVIWWFLKNFNIPRERLPHFCLAAVMNLALLVPGERIWSRRYRPDNDLFIATTSTQ